MDHFADQLTDKNWRVVKQLAGQISGRKPRRNHHDFGVESHHRRRGGQSPFKDIADSDKSEVAHWIREDKHHHIVGGSLSDAMKHTFHVLHHTYRRDYHKGGSFFDRIGSTLENIGRAGLSQADILADKFLSGMGLTKSRYENKTYPTKPVYTHA